MSADKPSRLPILALIGVAVCAAGGAAYWWSEQPAASGGDQPVQASVSTAQTDVISDKQTAPSNSTAEVVNETAATSADVDDAQVTQTEEQAAVPPTGPSIQDVRLEPDGLSVIAGRAEPLSEVVLFVDDMEVARAEADASGAFATLAMLDDNATDGARPLTIQQRGATGKVVDGQDTIFLAPAPQPDPEPSVDVTVAEPAPRVTTPAVAEPEVAPEAPVTETVILASPDATNAAAPAAVAEQTDTSPRRAEPAKIAVLKSDQSGVEVLNPSGPAPNVTGQIALDTISYSVDGAVKLQGRARSTSETVRVYLNNTAIAALGVDETGAWRGTLPDVDTGVFTLRIDEVDPDGQVTSRVETPFKREDPVVLEAALSQDKEALIKAITVQQGNTLWAIARERYGQGTEYVQVFEANRALIRDPDLIYPGQVLTLPQK